MSNIAKGILLAIGRFFIHGGLFMLTALAGAFGGYLLSKSLFIVWNILIMIGGAIVAVLISLKFIMFWQHLNK